jgi:propanol-preferring alcohol dehydrogenase
MKAAQVEAFGKPLVLKELDVPTPGPGQILVKTEACGVCHTDLHARNGDWPLKPPLPFTPGHEGIGIVAALGAGVTAVKEGERVGVPWLYSACGHCEFCLAAQEPVCAEAQFGGYTRNGGFAQYTRVPADAAVAIHSALSDAELASFPCA